MVAKLASRETARENAGLYVASRPRRKNGKLTAMSKRKRRWDTAQLAAGSKRLIDRVPAWAAGEGALVAVFLVLAVAAAFVPRPQPLPDFGAIEQVAERKQAFFEYMTPLVETENGRIQKERRQLLKIAGRLANDRQPSILDRNRLAHLAVKYDLSWPVDDWSEALSTLLRRVDTVPAGLVLAQAAEESGWGRSRFARQGNNLFGHWCYARGCGIVPAGRDTGAAHEVAAFDSVRDSVQRYLYNLNTHPAYRPFRQLRQAERQAGHEPRALVLAAGLGNYSQRGENYVADIRSIIRTNERLIDRAIKNSGQDTEAISG